MYADEVFMKKIIFGFRHDFAKLKGRSKVVNRETQEREIMISVGNLRDLQLNQLIAFWLNFQFLKSKSSIFMISHLAVHPQQSDAS